MILVALMLMQAGYSPETEAVMDRARRDAREERMANSQSKNQVEGLSVFLPQETAEQLQVCTDIAADDPEAGMKQAQEWIVKGGGFSARQCLGFALAGLGRWSEAVDAFNHAALDAQKAGAIADTARLWAQAGNAALAGNNPERARGFFDAALSFGLPDSLAKGEVYLDRARACVAMDDNIAARKDLDHALKLAASDPLAWLLSATLARRMDDLGRARADIMEAKQRAPNDASVALEAGNIAVLSGDDKSAKEEWARVLSLAPGSEQSKAARTMLSRLDGGADQSR